jgi:antirestriction protein ArdC
VLGLIFLRFADVRFAATHARLEKAASSSRRGSRVDDPGAYHAESVLYRTPNARFHHLLALSEDDHAAYLGHWLTVLKEDKRAIFSAAAHAHRAADYLGGLQQKQET